MPALKRLKISRLRNLDNISLTTLSPSINIFYGENGSGKTSLLEAISVLGLGRSFRSHKTRSLIQHNQAQLTVFGELLQDHSASASSSAIGVQKQRNGQTLIRIDGETIQSAVSLAQQMPLQIINADSFRLIEGSPQHRRRFLDWMVFHVKPEFIGLWRRFQRILKQRNSLLRRDKMTSHDLVPWETEFVQLSASIHSLRESVFEDFLVLYRNLQAECHDLMMDCELSYQRGWSLDQDLREILQQSLERDRRDGFTHHGPQRADIKITQNKKPAIDTLSRGQEKTLICALHVLQSRLYRENRGQPCVFLVDDILAELDEPRVRQLTSWLGKPGGQVFVTGVDKNQLSSIWQINDPTLSQSPEIAMFHVEQGNIKLT